MRTKPGHESGVCPEIETKSFRTGSQQRDGTARAATPIDRTDFGVTAARELADRFLDLTIEVRCERR